MNEPATVCAGHRKDSSRCPHNPKNHKVTVQRNSNDDSLQVEDVANVGIVKSHPV
jgi:hypothetical protein